MGDEAQAVTQDKPELCISVKLPANIELGHTKQELVVATIKVAQLEEKSELCIRKIGIRLPTYEELCIGSIDTKLPTTVVTGMYTT